MFQIRNLHTVNYNPTVVRSFSLFALREVKVVESLAVRLGWGPWGVRKEEEGQVIISLKYSIYSIAKEGDKLFPPSVNIAKKK